MGRLHGAPPFHFLSRSEKSYIKALCVLKKESIHLNISSISRGEAQLSAWQGRKPRFGCFTCWRREAADTVRGKADAQGENCWSGRRSKTHIPLFFFQSKGLETGSISACCKDCKTAKKILQCMGGDVCGQRKPMAWPEAQERFVPTALVCFCGIYFYHHGPGPRTASSLPAR